MARKFLLVSLCALCFSLFGEEKDPITPPVGPMVCNGADVFVTGEFLWWKGMQEGLRYATTGVLIQPNTHITSSGKSHSVHYPWKPGFRVGLGFYPKHDGWDLYARYTWFHSDSTDHAKNSDGNIVPLTVALPGITSLQVNGVNTARSHWDLHYNILDLELGRNFFLSRFLKTRLFFGVRGTWNSQKWESTYTSNQISFNGGPSLPGTLSSNQDQDAWGVGIRMGVNGTWTFYRGWSLVGDVSFAGVWIDYDTDRKDTVEETNVGTLTTAHIKSTPDTVIANIEMLLGLRGEWWFQRDSYHLSAQVGWENQIWIHYGRFIFLQGNNNGDLTFTGLSAKLRFDF